MATLSKTEQRNLEKLFNMSGGYVLDFSNNTFDNFIFETINVDAYDEKYTEDGGSKAKILTTIWKIEPNNKVGKLILGLLEYWKKNKNDLNEVITDQEKNLFNECSKIAEKLVQDNIIEGAEVFLEKTNEKEFDLLAKSIKESIETGEPEAALDRLHTYLMSFIRQLCEQNSIDFNNGETLNAIFGKYVNAILSKGKIDSKMTITILKTSISIEPIWYHDKIGRKVFI